MTELSVIIVNYDSASCLSDCLRGVLREPIVKTVIVVDNASTDGSVALLRGWAAREPRLQLVENPDNRGFAAACNQGLRLADTELMLLLNPDCVVRPGAVPRVCEVLAQDAAAGMAGCLIRNVDGSEQRGCRRYSPTLQRVAARFARLDRLREADQAAGFEQNREPLPDRPVEVEAISGAFMCVRRAAVEQAGMLDEGYFLHAEDLDWCLRFRNAGWRILFVPDAEAVHDRGVSSRRHLLAVHWHMHRSMARYYRKFLAPESAAPLNAGVIAAICARYLLLLPVVLVRALRFRIRNTRHAG